MKGDKMKYPIKNRYTGVVIFDAEINCSADADEGIKLGLAVRLAIKARAYLEGANLARANLARANLADANLADANLEGAYLEGANLARANLEGANLEGAYLEGANLARANLEGANLEGAYLARANLADANLADANLADARGLGNYFWFGPVGDSNRTGYAYEKDGKIYVSLGCRDDIALNVIESVNEKYGECDYLECVKFAVKIVQDRMRKE
jgi:hypothetical protein